MGPVAAASLAFALVSCGPGPGRGGPAVTITAPVDGSTVAVGEAVDISGVATAGAGVAWMELYVNGRIVRTYEAFEEISLSLPVKLSWIPIVEGDAVLSIVAYDTDVAASEPAVVTLHVVCNDPPCLPTVAAQGTEVTLPMSALLDLDSGAVSDTDDEGVADLWWRAGLEGAAIVGMHGMMLADLGVGDGLPTAADCFSTPLTAPSIQTPLLQSGYRLCFNTTEGNLAALYVEDIQVPGAHNLVLSFVTWQEAP